VTVKNRTTWLDKLVKEAVGGAIDELRLDESYVVQSKPYTFSTESSSEKTRQMHQQMLDRYVKTLNDVSAKLDTADRNIDGSTSEFGSLKRDEIKNANAAFLHGLFFENIGDPTSQVTTDSLSFMRLERDFGNFSMWQSDFIACCLASKSGWAITCYNVYLGRYMNVVVDLHSTGVTVGCIPLIVIDCWEHSYLIDYVDDRKAYVFAMMKELRWPVIEDRFKRAEAIAKVMVK